MPKTHPSISIQRKWENAVAMAAHSLIHDGDVSPVVPKNFTNGKNAAPRGVQNYDLSLMQYIEGYSTNLWATPRQIAEIGGEVDELAPRATICIAKTSKKGTSYYTTYKVVNLDEVSFPNGISQEAYDKIVETSQLREDYEVPRVSTFSPDYTIMTKKDAPKPKKDAPKVALSNVPAPKKAAPKDAPKPKKDARATNLLSPQSKEAPNVGRPANAVADIVFDGQPFHFEGRTIDEVALLMDHTLDAYVKAKKRLG